MPPPPVREKHLHRYQTRYAGSLIGNHARGACCQLLQTLSIYLFDPRISQERTLECSLCFQDQPTSDFVVFHGKDVDEECPGQACGSCVASITREWNRPDVGLVSFIGERCPLAAGHTCPGVASVWEDWTTSVEASASRMARLRLTDADLTTFRNTLVCAMSLPRTMLVRCPTCSRYKDCRWEWEFTPQLPSTGGGGGDGESDHADLKAVVAALQKASPVREV